ncbi:MAG: UDP-N-acetylglucosamine 1-carboxyvinyltransferase [Eubacterium sp.]
MEILEIIGKSRLGGEIDVHGAKNSVLPILAGSVLIKGTSVIHNCPKLSDVEVTISILKHIGAKISREGSTLIVDASGIDKCDIPEELMQEMRSSIIFLGSLSSRLGKACMYLPGGCEIGLRPIDLHLKGLTSLGYSISFDGHNICCNKSSVKANKIVLPFPSVGATENIILAAVLTKGKTTIINAAREPEIVDLANYLNKAGAKIFGASTPVIEIEGVEELGSVEHTVIPDRILATTLMSASAITSSELILKKVNPAHLMPILPVFDEMGCKLFVDRNALKIKAPKRLKRVKKIETQPYPGFPTDCQAPVMAALTTAKGTSVINETIFESRFKHISQLCRFGADIEVNDRVAIVNGTCDIHSAGAVCTDLRGGAAVVIEALAANGVSTIKNIEHIDRGYESIEKQLSSIGADIKRINYEEKGKEKI